MVIFENVDVAEVSLVAKVTKYWIYRCPSVTQALALISAPLVIPVQEANAVAPLIPLSLLVLALTVAVVLVGVVAEKLNVPHSESWDVSKIFEIRVPELA